MVNTDGRKRCPGCTEAKPVTDYTISRASYDGFQTYCKPCLAVRKKAADKVLKEEVFAAYGGRCQCPHCDEACIDFLTIDHINGDGAASKRNGEGSGTSLWRFLKRNNYPRDRHRLLCFNCNCARRFGPCPHERHSAAAVAASSTQLSFSF